MFKRNENGFSLVELSLAAAVAVVLTTVAVAVVTGTSATISESANSAAAVETCEIVEALKGGSDEIINNCQPTTSEAIQPPSEPEPEAPAGPTTLTVFDAATGYNNSITGGWTTVQVGGTTSPILSITSDAVGLRAPYWCDGDAYTVNTIDFTNVESMTLTFSSSGVTPTYFYANLNWPLAGGGEAGYTLGSPSFANIAQNTVNIPVENGGVGKLRLRVTNSSGGFVYLHTLILNYKSGTTAPATSTSTAPSTSSSTSSAPTGTINPTSTIIPAGSVETFVWNRSSDNTTWDNLSNYTFPANTPLGHYYMVLWNDYSNNYTNVAAGGGSYRTTRVFSLHVVSQYDFNKRTASAQNLNLPGNYGNCCEWIDGVRITNTTRGQLMADVMPGSATYAEYHTAGNTVMVVPGDTISLSVLLKGPYTEYLNWQHNAR
jgi:hypothetical protein